jgi:hypothetical protein
LNLFNSICILYIKYITNDDIPIYIGLKFNLLVCFVVVVVVEMDNIIIINITKIKLEKKKKNKKSRKVFNSTKTTTNILK